ncbi:MAG: hypothetical protein AABX71_01460 [Nanoarchaeota archaeon]
MAGKTDLKKAAIGALLGKGDEELGKGTLKLKKKTAKYKGLAGTIARKRLKERKVTKDLEKELNKY